ncbi:MAG TPA: hypothetical protein VGR18_16720 [Rubrobacter sp.]|nr:hypothetical protein [Rubrobacter sp.]
MRIYGRIPNGFRAAPEGSRVRRGRARKPLPDPGGRRGIEEVFHLASTTIPKTSNDDPIYDVRSNLVNALDLAA